jgi:hypothetical protein
MALFQRNVNSDLLVAIEYTKVLFACNYGVESVIYDLSNKRFGHVTDLAKKVLRKINSGKTMNESLLDEKAATSNKNMKYFIDALGGTSTRDITTRLTDVGKHIIAEKKLYVENFIDNLKIKMNWLIVLMALPMLVYFLSELSIDVFTGFGQIEQMIKFGVFAIAAVGTFVVLAMLRYKE